MCEVRLLTQYKTAGVVFALHYEIAQKQKLKRVCISKQFIQIDARLYIGRVSNEFNVINELKWNIRITKRTKLQKE